MKAAIFNPYWDTLGGGERYTISVAKALADSGYKVDIEWKGQDLLKKIEQRFGMALQNISIVNDINRGREYDVCFWVSDGSIPLLYSRKNILHFQIPFKLRANNLMNRMKLVRINKIVCNSHFTKQFIDISYGVKSAVLYPPIDTKVIKPKKKENIILYVGRFSNLTQSKKQDILIDCFKKLFETGVNNYRLILAGGAEVGAGDRVEQLSELSNGYPVKIVVGPTFKELKDYYAKAKFFWSAAGYGVDVDKNPKQVEHFGITVVEAMAAGCVPLVFDAGGHREIISEGKNGFLWQSTDFLIDKTAILVKNPKNYVALAKQAKVDSENYNYEKFKENFLSLL